MTYIFRYIICFLFWNLYIYIIHRIGHIKSNKNIIYFIHRYHHSKSYIKGSSKIPKWYNFLWYFGHPLATLDVILQQTIGIYIIYKLDPEYGWFLIPFHYFYEILLSDGILDHNPKIMGWITKYFAIGEYHLKHHYKSTSNYGLYITLFDYIFQTNSN